MRENAPIQIEQESQTSEYLQSIYGRKYKQGSRNIQTRQSQAGEVLPKIRRDIQAALTVIGRRNSLLEAENQKLDLRNTDIRRADLLGANLARVDLPY